MMGSRARTFNKAAIRQALDDGQPRSIAEIAEETGLSRDVVRRWLDNLRIEGGTVEKIGRGIWRKA